MKTSELERAALDWAVAKCEGREKTFGWGKAAKFGYYPSKRWSQGGPIIERENLELSRTTDDWRAQRCDFPCAAYGPTPLVAAMRCYVASKLGDEVEIPKELK